MKPCFTRRIAGLACSAMFAAGALTPAAAQDTIKIGYAISKTGPNAGGAGITTLPNYQLWVKDVNDAGGIDVGGKKMKIEVVEYDDRSSSEEAVRAGRAHAAAFRQLAEQAAMGYEGRDQLGWLDRIEADEANLLRAARWIRERGPRIVVVKKGENGAILYGDDWIFFTPGWTPGWPTTASR